MSAECNDMSTDTLIVIDDHATRGWQVVAFNRNIVVRVDNIAHQSLLLGIPKCDDELAGECARSLNPSVLLNVYRELGCAHLAINLNNGAVFDSIGRLERIILENNELSQRVFRVLIKAECIASVTCAIRCMPAVPAEGSDFTLEQFQLILLTC